MSYLHEQTEAVLFQLKHVAKTDELARHALFAQADEATVEALLESALAFSRDQLLPLAASGDRDGCSLRDGQVSLPDGTQGVYRQWRELGFPALGLPVEIDGLGLPRSVQSAVQELCDGANLSFGMLCINLRCAALALLKSATKDQQARWLPGLVNGELASTIVISEPQAGSDVGRITTTARAVADGYYELTGSKIWISYGDHDVTDNILHLVLARLPGSEDGSRGLSLFAVPKKLDGNTNHVHVLRLEHKMGLHASPTCVLEFEQSRGELIGETGRGLQALFVMMNNMRLAVSVQGAAVANAATVQAWSYAAERPQGGHPFSPPVNIIQHADVQRMLLEMTADSELARALALRTAGMLDTAEALANSGINDEAKRLQGLAELILPIAKTINAETAFVVANQGIQVMGGYGYTCDYPLERMARDIRVAAIYEGTSGIQALDFSKRKVAGDNAATLEELVDLVNNSLEQGASPFTEVWPEVRNRMQQRVAALLSLSKEQRNLADAGAYALLQLAALMLHCWNGHTLFNAASESIPAQYRLRAALTLFAGSVTAKAALWATRNALEIPAFPLTK